MVGYFFEVKNLQHRFSRTELLIGNEGLEKLKKSELILKNDEFYIKDYTLDKYENYFEKFNKYKNRGVFRTFVTNIMYVVQHNKLCVLSDNDEKKYIKSFKSISSLKNEFDKIKGLFDFVFSPKLLKHSSPNICSKYFNKNYLISLMFFFSDKYEKYVDDNLFQDKLRKMIIDSAKNCKDEIGGDNKYTSLKSIYNMLEEEFEKLVEENQPDTKDDNFEILIKMHKSSNPTKTTTPAKNIKRKK